MGGAAGVVDRLPPAGQPGRELRGRARGGGRRARCLRTFFIAPLTCLLVPIITIVIGGAAGGGERLIRRAGQPG